MADVGVAPDFDGAERHSGRVRFLRWALPVVIVAGLAAYYLTSRLPSVNLPIDFDNIVVDDGGIIIERPRLTNYQAGGEAYEVAADRAIQTTDDPESLRLEGVTARYELPSGGIAEFAAPMGEYNTATSLLTLRGRVTMSIGEGVEIQLEAVTVDVPNGLIASDGPFQLQAGNLAMRGDHLALSQSSMRITGRVETMFATTGPSAVLPRIGGVTQ